MFAVVFAEAAAGAQFITAAASDWPSAADHRGPGKSDANRAKHDSRDRRGQLIHPSPQRRSRLRNLQTNQIEQVATANQIGEFSFSAQPEIPYVVEIADEPGKLSPSAMWLWHKPVK